MSRKNKGGSSTPGRSKGANCHRSVLKNLYCKDTRLHKTNPKLFLAACIEVSSMKGNLPTTEVIESRKGNY